MIKTKIIGDQKTIVFSTCTPSIFAQLQQKAANLSPHQSLIRARGELSSSIFEQLFKTIPQLRLSLFQQQDHRCFQSDFQVPAAVSKIVSLMLSALRWSKDWQGLEPPKPLKPQDPPPPPLLLHLPWSNCTGRSNASWALGSPQFRALAFLQPIQAGDFPRR